MSSYMLRQVDREELHAFRARCAEHGLKPDDVLRAFIAGATLRYQIVNGYVACNFIGALVTHPIVMAK